MAVFDENGQRLFQLPFTVLDRQNVVQWVPDSRLENGRYEIRFSGTGFDGVEDSAQAALSIDNRFLREPRLSGSGLPGLHYSPGAAMLPPSLWQISTGAGYYSIPGSSENTEAVPAWATIRFSPLARLELNGNFGITARFPTEKSSLAFSAAASWRASGREGPFKANLAILYSFNGYLSELGRIPPDNQAANLPGLQLAGPMEYEIGNWCLVWSPALNLSFIRGSESEWQLTAYPAVSGYLGLGTYYEHRQGMFGASVGFRTPAGPEEFLDWNIFTGLEARFDLPGDASFIAVSAAVRALGDEPLLKMSLEFGVIN